MNIKLIIYHLFPPQRDPASGGTFVIRKSRGFTLVELAVVTSIIITLLGFITISLVSLRQKASLTSAEGVLLADLKQQQLKAMIGDTDGEATADSYGIHFDSSRYVLFRGSIYSSENSSNSAIDLEGNMQFDNGGFDIVFSRLSGEISTATTIELQDNTNSSLKRIHLNVFGVVTQIESL